MHRLLLPLLTVCLFGPLAGWGAPRTWTSINGATVTAEFVEMSGNLVVLRDANGRTKSIPLNRLSFVDRQFLNRQHGVGASNPSQPQVTPPAPRPANPRITPPGRNPVIHLKDNFSKRATLTVMEGKMASRR